MQPRQKKENIGLVLMFVFQNNINIIPAEVSYINLSCGIRHPISMAYLEIKLKNFHYCVME